MLCKGPCASHPFHPGQLGERMFWQKHFCELSQINLSFSEVADMLVMAIFIAVVFVQSDPITLAETHCERFSAQPHFFGSQTPTPWSNQRLSLLFRSLRPPPCVSVVGMAGTSHTRSSIIISTGLLVFRSGRFAAER